MSSSHRTLVEVWLAQWLKLPYFLTKKNTTKSTLKITKILKICCVKLQVRIRLQKIICILSSIWSWTAKTSARATWRFTQMKLKRMNSSKFRFINLWMSSKIHLKTIADSNQMKLHYQSTTIGFVFHLCPIQSTKNWGRSGTIKIHRRINNCRKCNQE